MPDPTTNAHAAVDYMYSEHRRQIREKNRQINALQAEKGELQRALQAKTAEARPSGFKRTCGLSDQASGAICNRERDHTGQHFLSTAESRPHTRPPQQTIQSTAKENPMTNDTPTPVFSDAEWREFQSLPDQGYSHRHWVDHKIAALVREALAQEPTSAECVAVLDVRYGAPLGRHNEPYDAEEMAGARAALSAARDAR